MILMPVITRIDERSAVPVPAIALID